MTGDCHVRFCENAGVKLPCVTQLAAIRNPIMDTFNKVTRPSHMKLHFFRRFIYGFIIFFALYFALHTYAQIKKQEVITNIQARKPVGYLISLSNFSATVNNREVIQAALKIIGHWQQIMGMTNDSVNMNLFIVPAAEKDVEELTEQLQAIPKVRNVSVVAWSKPAKAAELAAVRKMLTRYNLNANTVNDKQLSMFLNSKLDGQYTYYIDQDRQLNLKGLHDMHIKRLDEHPQYSPAWRKDRVVKQQDTIQNSDTIEVQDVVIQTIKEVEPPPPPPPPPANLGQMSNAQIRRWIQKNDSRNMKDKDIRINRTAQEVMITLKFKKGTEIVHYKIKK